MPIISIPQKIEGMNQSEKYIFNKIKQIYMAEPSISYLYLEPKIKNLMPDFILIDPLRGIVIIEVKAWSLDFIESINGKEVKTTKGEILENPSYKARRYFNILKGLFSFQDTLLDEEGELNIKLHSLITFTELSQDEASENEFESLFNHYPARVLYKNELTHLDIGKLFNNETKVIDPLLVDTIRASIFPEIKIVQAQSKNDFSVLDKNLLALDFEQERFSKSLPMGHYMITGFPGSGKTVALLSRALYLAKLYPEWKILIVTYNKSLKLQLQAKIDTIKEELNYIDVSLDKIEVHHFHQIAMQYSSLSPQDVPYKERDEFWKDTLPNDALKHVKPRYDAVLVDEYQDFYKNWFELLLKLLFVHKEKDKEHINLFLAGDRLQSIYNPKEVNWKQDIGLDMRGRSKLLKSSYRITKEHIHLGLSLLRKDKNYKSEVEKFYDEGKNILLKNTTEDSIELLEGSYQEIASLIENLLSTEYNYQDILVLSPQWKTLDKVKKHLSLDIQKKIVSSKEVNHNKMIFSTYHSAKGIEAKIAIVLDIETIKERKLLYVASTRASHKLILHAQNFEDSKISQEIFDLMAEEALV